MEIKFKPRFCNPKYKNLLLIQIEGTFNEDEFLYDRTEVFFHLKEDVRLSEFKPLTQWDAALTSLKREPSSNYNNIDIPFWEQLECGTIIPYAKGYGFMKVTDYYILCYDNSGNLFELTCTW